MIWFGPPTGPSISVQRGGDPRYYAEREITAGLIEVLLHAGHNASDMALERRIGPGSRPDLTVEPPCGPVSLWEVKRGRPGARGRRQLDRYVAVGRARWPDRTVLVYAVWPADFAGFVFGSSDTLVIQAIA